MVLLKDQISLVLKVMLLLFVMMVQVSLVMQSLQMVKVDTGVIALVDI